MTSIPNPSVPLTTAVLALLALSGCRSPERPDPALPPSPPVVTVEMGDYRFDYNPEIPAGRVVFQVRNTGRVLHNLALLPLPDNLPPIDVQLRGSQREFLAPFAGSRPGEPGSTGSFAADLTPGRRYAMICTLLDPEGRSHAARGMASEFRTPAP